MYIDFPSQRARRVRKIRLPVQISLCTDLSSLQCYLFSNQLGDLLNMVVERQLKDRPRLLLPKLYNL